MTFRLILAASALLAFAAPAVAQEAPQDAPAAPIAATPEASPEQLALEAKAEAFKGRMESMAGEIRAALAAAGGDEARAGGELDAIVARYQPEADAFADEVAAFINAEAAKDQEASPAELSAALSGAVAAIKGIPGQIRTGVVASAASEAAPQ